MFWKKKQDQVVVEAVPAAEPIQPAPKSKQEVLGDAAKKLAASLRSYADASYAAQKPAPDEELMAAHRKVEIVRKIATEGRIAYALGRCLPEHMAHWHTWSKRDDFMKWVGFGCQGRRPETRIALANQRYRIIANAVADPVVRRSANRLVPDRRRAVRAHPLQKPTDLAGAQIKHMRRRHHGHPAVDHLRQNLDPLQITLAHRNQSHLQSPPSSKPGRE
jgi:hypothetical protein